MSIHLSIQLDDPALLAEVAAKKPSGFQMMHGNTLVGEVGVKDAHLLTEMLQVLTVTRPSASASAYAYAVRIADEVGLHLENVGSLNTTPIIAHILRNYDEIVEATEIPSLEPLANFVKNVLPRGDRANFHDSVADRDTLLYRWLTTVVGEYQAAQIYRLAVDGFVKNSDGTEDHFDDDECFLRAFETLATLPAVAVGDLIYGGGDRDNAMFIVTAYRMLERLPTDGNAYGIISAEHTADVEDPIAFWGNDEGRYIELGPSHPKNTHEQTVCFQIYDRNTGYDDPCFDNPRDF